MKSCCTGTTIIQRALYELEPVVFSPTNIKSLLKERQREVPKVELLKFLEAVGGCDTEMDFEENRCMSDLVTFPAGEHRERSLHERCAPGVW